MKVILDQILFKKFNPHFKLVLISVKGMDNRNKARESQHLVKETEKLIKLTFNRDNVKSHKLISPWAAAQQDFGDEAIHYKTSVEHLIKKVINNHDVSVGDTLTNLLNYISLRQVVPIGVDDYDKLKGNVSFTVALGGEKVGVFHLLKKNAFYYHDKKGPIGTKFDYWKNPRTKLNKSSQNALIHLEILPPISDEDMNKIILKLKNVISGFCGGKVKIAVLSRRKRSVVM